MKISTVCLISLFVYAFLAVFVFFIGHDEKVVGKIPCVDGQNRVNLEGIMCEDTQETIFGYERYYAFFIFLIPIIIIGAIAFIAIQSEE